MDLSFKLFKRAYGSYILMQFFHSIALPRYNRKIQELVVVLLLISIRWLFISSKKNVIFGNQSYIQRVYFCSGWQRKTCFCFGATRVLISFLVNTAHVIVSNFILFVNMYYMWADIWHGMFAPYFVKFVTSL